MVQRIYLDTNIFIHCGLSQLDQGKAKRSKKLLEQISQGKYEGVVSTLCLLEICEVVRGLAVEVLGVNSPADWKAMISSTIEFIFKNKNIKVIESNPEERLGTSKIKDLMYCSVVDDAHRMIVKYSGTTKEERGKFVHKGVGCVDCLHLALAKMVECDLIATFDRGFEETRIEVEPLIIQDKVW